MSISDPSPVGPAGDTALAATARVELASRTRSLELSIVSSDFRLVANAMGRLSVELPPGIYQVVARAGPTVERKLIRLDPGSTYRDDDVAVAFPTAAPVQETSTSNDVQQSAAERVSSALGQAPGPPSGLVIVVRDIRGSEGPPLEPGDVACFGLFDGQLNPVAGFEQGWTVDAQSAVATWGGRLPMGGYVLRTDPAKVVGPRRPPTTQAFDQSIWLAENWQTIVFITTGPGGPQTSAASIHVIDLYLGWSGNETDTGLALELANLGLREGRSVLPDDLTTVLLDVKFENPMLGIIGVHSLLLRSEPDARLVNFVLDKLDGLVPGHPDVLALRWIAASRFADGVAVDAVAARVPDGGATWPPMLLPSYRGLIAMDAMHPNAIADGSVAELAAANLLVNGLWTSWKPLGAAPVAARRLPAAVGTRGVPVAEVLPALASNPSLIDGIPRTDPATARVAAYLGGVAALEGTDGRVDRFATLSPQEISLATTLPVATVDRALARIAAAMPTAGGGGGSEGSIEGSGGGGGGSGSGALGGLARLSLPVLAAGALLLAGVVGAVAWCAGSEGCPFLPAPPAATAQPTTLLTPLPTVTPSPEPTEEPPTRPPPEPTPVLLEYTPQVDFGQVTIAGEPGVRPLTILSPERPSLSFELIDGPESEFKVDSGCDWTETEFVLFGCTVVVTFSPQVEGPRTGSVTMLVGDQNDQRPISLIGEGVAPFLRFPHVVEFDTATIGFPVERELVIFGDQPIPLELAITMDDWGAFSTDPGCDWTQDDSSLYRCVVRVTFAPLMMGEQRAFMGIFVGAMKPLDVEMVGHGLEPFGRTVDSQATGWSIIPTTPALLSWAPE